MLLLSYMHMNNYCLNLEAGMSSCHAMANHGQFKFIAYVLDYPLAYLNTLIIM